MPGQEFYSEEEAQKILRLASEETGTNHVTRDELLRAALEAGIPTSAVEIAEARIRSESTLVSAAEEYRLAQVSKFRTSTASMLGLAVFLFGLNFLTGMGKIWAIWPVGIYFLWWISEFIETAVGQPWRDPEKVQAWVKRRVEKAETAEE